MACARQMVVVYLHIQDAESLCLSISTQSGANLGFIK
jgi:hypothetical protein